MIGWSISVRPMGMNKDDPNYYRDVLYSDTTTVLGVYGDVEETANKCVELNGGYPNIFRTTIKKLRPALESYRTKSTWRTSMDKLPSMDKLDALPDDTIVDVCFWDES